MGELLAAMAEAGERNKQGRPSANNSKKELLELGENGSIYPRPKGTGR
jgi:hypothetical protein